MLCLYARGQQTTKFEAWGDFGAEARFDLYRINKALQKGEKTGLLEIATYFSKRDSLVDWLGYHRIISEQRDVAKRIMHENAFFLPSEVDVANASDTVFIKFLTANMDRIVFSPLAGAFIISPLENRDAYCELKYLPLTNKKQLTDKANKFLQSKEAREDGIDALVKQKDPRALLQITSSLVRTRSRYNQYWFDSEERMALLEILTGTSFATKNEKGELVHQIDNDYYPTARLNLLIYFAKNYTAYVWDDKKNLFVNPHAAVEVLDNETRLFEQLKSEANDEAVEAFLKLSECDPERVIPLATEYDRSNFLDKRNYALPIFVFRFLKQMCVLTKYCRDNSIDYHGSPAVLQYISILKSPIPFKERYKIENNIISSLTLDEITAFEYWALVNEESTMGYSAGRIVDVFYSYKWDSIIHNKKYLDCYLKKSRLFDELGIIGECNNYLLKFYNASPDVLNIVANNTTTDIDIKNQMAKIAAGNIYETNRREKSSKKEWDGNKDSHIYNVKQKLDKLKIPKEKKDGKSDDYDDKKITLDHIMAQINYYQIDTVMEYLDRMALLYPKYINDKYYFLVSDFGLPMEISRWGSFDKSVIKEFESKFRTMTEYQVYAYYLDIINIDFRAADSSLDYDKIYELIKHDEVTPLVGGAGGSQVNEVYALIKLLELKLNTTLGFPKKLCSHDDMYRCKAKQRAHEWMQYLESNKLLKWTHKQPVSFTFDD